MKNYLVTNRTLGVAEIVKAVSPAYAFTKFNLADYNTNILWDSDEIMAALLEINAKTLQPTALKNVYEIIK